MNSPFVIEQAQSLANRPELVEAKRPAEQVRVLYQLTLAREPDSDEQQIAEQFLAAAPVVSDGIKLNPTVQLAQLLLLTNEFMYVD